MRRLLIPLGILILAAILVTAFGWDSLRAAREMEAELATADADLIVQENRLVQIVSGWPEAPPPLTASLQKYRESDTRTDRHAAFDALVIETNRAIAEAEKNEKAISSSLSDNIAGAINRRTFAERRFREIEAGQEQWQSTLRGRVGRTLLNGMQ